MFFYQTHQFFELLRSISFESPRIHELPVMLDEVEHLVLLYAMLGWIALIRQNKLNHRLIPYYPPFVLCHKLSLAMKHTLIHHQHLIQHLAIFQISFLLSLYHFGLLHKVA